MHPITKEQFVAVLDGAGITDAQKHRIHALFEQRHPEAHQDFLAYVGISPEGIAKMRQQSRQP